MFFNIIIQMRYCENDRCSRRTTQHDNCCYNANDQFLDVFLAPCFILAEFVDAVFQQIYFFSIIDRTIKQKVYNIYTRRDPITTPASART